MLFEFNLPSLEEMRSTKEGLEMIRMIDGDDGFSSTLVTGGPGTGKTTVAIYRLASRMNRPSAKAHLVTYQNLLVLAIQNIADGVVDIPEHCVSTFHKWFCPKVNMGFNTESPPSFEVMVERLNKSSLPAMKMDEFFIDEGQDLPVCVYQALPRYFKSIFIGADDAQQVHVKQGACVEQIANILEVNSKKHRNFTLSRNFRNTIEIYRFARQFLPKNNRIAWSEDILHRLERANQRGGKPKVVSYVDLEKRNEHLRITLDNAKGNVAILCPLGPGEGKFSGQAVDEVHRLVTDLGFDASKYHNKLDVPGELKRYVVTTFKSSKGLEFSTVIIPRINFFQQILPQWYVACTRAISNLVIYRDTKYPEYDPIQNLEEDTYDSISLDSGSKDKNGEGF